MSNLSIAIPTRNRAKILMELLDSILRQTVSPREVVVVDDSDNDDTKNLVKQMWRYFSDTGIEIKYVRGGGEGVTQARNIGITHATSEIHCSLDDDVVLDKDYIKEILNVFDHHSNALGVSGHVANIRIAAASNAFNKLFSLFHTSQDECRVFPAGISYPYPLTQIINCEWLSGTDCSYKRNIHQEFMWDENLKQYSLCDDMDISYRIQKSHPASLFITPNAKCNHKWTPLGRINSARQIYMEVYHHAYFFFKNMRQTTRNMLSFVFTMFLGNTLSKLLTWNMSSVILVIRANLSLVRNLQEIKAGNFPSLNPIDQSYGQRVRTTKEIFS